MGIRFAMKHQNGAGDGRKCHRVDALIYETDHVRPRLFVSYSVDKGLIGLSVVDVVAIHSRHHAAPFREAAIWVLFSLCQVRDARVIGRRQSSRTSCLELCPSRLRKCAAPDENQRGRGQRMVRGINERQHRAPGVAYEDRLSGTATCPNQIIQILHMRRDGQWSVTAAALMGLEHMPPFAQSSGEGRKVARRSRSAVHSNHRLDSDPVLPNEIGHLILSSSG